MGSWIGGLMDWRLVEWTALPPTCFLLDLVGDGLTGGRDGLTSFDRRLDGAKADDDDGGGGTRLHGYLSYMGYNG